MGQKKKFSEELVVGKKNGKNRRSYHKKMLRKIVTVVGIRRQPPDERTQKFRICLQIQTTSSCRLETDMDDSVAAVTGAVAAYRRRKQRIKNINKLELILGLLDVEDAIVSQENIRSFCNLRRTAAVSYVLGTDYYMLLEVTCTGLFAWHVASPK